MCGLEVFHPFTRQPRTQATRDLTTNRWPSGMRLLRGVPLTPSHPRLSIVGSSRTVELMSSIKSSGVKPEIGSGVGVDEHATLLSSWVSKTLTAHFPAPKTRPRKEYVTTTTWNLTLQRLQVKRRFREVKWEGACVTTHFAFTAWRMGVPLRRRHFVSVFLRLFANVVQLRKQAVAMT